MVDSRVMWSASKESVEREPLFLGIILTLSLLIGCGFIGFIFWEIHSSLSDIKSILDHTTNYTTISF